MRSHPRLLQSKKERLCSLLAPVGIKARHLSGYVHEGTTSPELLSQFTIFSFVCLVGFYLFTESIPMLSVQQRRKKSFLPWGNNNAWQGASQCTSWPGQDGCSEWADSISDGKLGQHFP